MFSNHADDDTALSPLLVAMGEAPEREGLAPTRRCRFEGFAVHLHVSQWPSVGFA